MSNNCPSCGAMLTQLSNGDSKCEFCGMLIKSGVDTVSFDTLLGRVTEATGSGNIDLAKRMADKLTEDHPRSPQAWLAKGNCSVKAADRDYAYSMAVSLMGEDDGIIIGFAWDPMLLNWGCKLDLDGTIVPLGPAMRYRTIVDRGEHRARLESPKNRLSAEKTLKIDHPVEVDMRAKVGIICKSLVMDVKDL